MHHDHQHTQQSSFQNLFAEALRETTDLARKEFALFRTEMSHNAKLFVAGLVGLVGAAIFAVATLILLTDALVSFVSRLVGSPILGALIVAGITAILAVAFGLYARSKLSAATLEPKHTIRSVERDATILTERVSS